MDTYLLFPHRLNVQPFKACINVLAKGSLFFFFSKLIFVRGKEQRSHGMFYKFAYEDIAVFMKRL